MTDTHHATPEGEEAPPPFRSDRPMWAPGGAIVRVPAALALVPIARIALLPTRLEGTVGLYERSALAADDGHRAVSLYFLPPQG